MIVKICGLKTFAGAMAAIEAGADMLGFNFYPPSPRYLAPAECAALVAALRKSLDRQAAPLLVGVFVNSPPERVAAVLDRCGLDLAQLSGDEPPEDLQALGERAFKALRPRSADEMRSAAARYPTRRQAPAFLIDANRPGAFGGTGEAADWDLAYELSRRAPVLLAGGLKAENVAQAVRAVRPWGVDAASGVESSPGTKDPARIAAFTRAARSVETERMEAR